MLLLDLPPDVLSVILSFLEPKDYLAFCQTSASVYSEWRQDPFYWRTEAHNTFRLPISPLLAADGPRWYWLYKRLKTQTQLYTWGQGLAGNLGPMRGRSLPRRPQLPIAPRVLPRIPARPAFPRGPQRPVYPRVASSWPTETDVPDEVGPIADLQCGGWSTTILASDGNLYSVGSINAHGFSADCLTRLEYLTQSTSAIRQFSSGRAHVLALTDHGDIISWDRINAKGLKVLSRNGGFGGKPVGVAAGWGESSAYIPEVGILYWKPVVNNGNDDMLDAMSVKEKVIPGTARSKVDTGQVEVTKHVVLEDFVVWINTDSKLYACCLMSQDADQSTPDKAPFLVPGFSAPDRELKDIQGQFRRFAVFTATGEVLAGDIDYLKRCAEAIDDQPGLSESGDWSTLTTLLASRPDDVPALQHSNVIALAFGDYHYHALHSDGKITSYGVDSQSCGSLGLSGPETGGRFRGLRRTRPGLRSDASLLPIANLRGRRVWFEPEKKDWLQWMEDQLHEPRLAIDGRPAYHIWDEDPSKQAAFSEWVEQEGNHWEEGPVGSSEAVQNPGSELEQNVDDYANLGAYFPIAIAAAGWHSGALVLVDEEREHEVRSKWVTHRQKGEETTHSMPGAFESLSMEEVYVWKRDGFPKVRLPNSYEMPGEGPTRPWRDGIPTMHELGLEA